MDNHKSRITIGEIAGTIFILVLVVIFAKLSLWQMRRLHDRRASNARISARMYAPPVPADGILTDTVGALYRRITIHGSFDDAHTIILPGRALSGTPGVHVLTPVRTDDGGPAVLVIRGWAPSPDAATVDLDAIRSKPLPAITGLALPFPSRASSISQSGDSTPRSGEFQRVWYTIDEHALRAQFPYPLAPFAIQMLPAPALTGLPRPLPPPALDEGPHLSYAIQWLAFAIIAIVGWIIFLVRRRAEQRSGRVVIAPPHPPAL